MLRAVRTPVVAALALIAGVGIAACGSGPTLPALSRADVDAALSVAPTTPWPRPAKALEAQAGQLLAKPDDDAVRRLDQIVRSLRGTPVVVNVWGEWCGPCKKEMPVFQRVALAQRGKVVFLGVATYGDRGDAEAYLRTKMAIPYTSLRDGPGDVTKATGIGGVPKTIFYDRNGKRLVHQGPYETEADLEADIRRYAS
ncbi:MAG: TlpA disulfide reductase family protein [Patulibacter minatonensis]